MNRMGADLVVGIDAGATKTRAFVVDRAGEVVGRGAGGGANLHSSPDPQGSIAAALNEALAGREAEAIVLSCAGADRKAEVNADECVECSNCYRVMGSEGYSPFLVWTVRKVLAGEVWLEKRAVSRAIDYVLPFGDILLGVTKLDVQPDSQLSGFVRAVEQASRVEGRVREQVRVAADVVQQVGGIQRERADGRDEAVMRV